MRVRRATREDIERFSELASKPTVKAWIGEVDGEVVAMAGFALFKGRWLAFCDIADRAKVGKMALARAARRAFDEARKEGVKYVYAEADLTVPGSVRWLMSLGFEHDPRTAYLYRWRA